MLYRELAAGVSQQDSLSWNGFVRCKVKAVRVAEPFPYVIGVRISKQRFVSVSQRLRNWWQLFPVSGIAAFLNFPCAMNKGGTTSRFVPDPV